LCADYLLSWSAIWSNHFSQFLLLSTFVGRPRGPQVCLHASCIDHLTFEKKTINQNSMINTWSSIRIKWSIHEKSSIRIKWSIHDHQSVFWLMMYRIDVLCIYYTIWFIYPSNHQLQLIPLIVYFCRSPPWPQHMWSHVCISWSYITCTCLLINYYILTTACYHLLLDVIYSTFMTMRT